jgi:hypothetical protein
MLSSFPLQGEAVVSRFQRRAPQPPGGKKIWKRILAFQEGGAPLRKGVRQIFRLAA